LIFAVSRQVYAGALLTLGVANTLALFLMAQRRIPGCSDLRITLADAHKGMAHRSGALRFWLISLAQAATNQGLVLVLAITTNATMVTIYVTHRTLISVAGFISSLPQGPILPELSFLWARDRLPEMGEVSFTLIRLLVFATGLVAIGIWVFAPFIFPAWTRGRLQLNQCLLAVLLIQGVLASGWSTSSWSLLATNHHREVALCSVANAALTLGLAVWLSAKYGIVGAAVANLTGDVVCGLTTFPLLVARFFKTPVARIYQEMFWPCVELVPLLLIAVITRGMFAERSCALAFVIAGVIAQYAICALFPGSAGRSGLQLLGIGVGRGMKPIPFFTRL
jgi:O-antigen/teichoic acid export membrane protein